jgi:hypothetical protein
MLATLLAIIGWVGLGLLLVGKRKPAQEIISDYSDGDSRTATFAREMGAIVSVRILIGDCREKLRELPDASVNCCVTSPPYFGLRDYGVRRADGP